MVKVEIMLKLLMEELVKRERGGGQSGGGAGAF